MDGATSSSLNPPTADLKRTTTPASAISVTSSNISPFTKPNPFDPAAPAKNERIPKPPSKHRWDPSTSTSAPPYWTQSHNRVASNISVDSVARGGITLTDNTDGTSETSSACWCRGVEIPSYEVVNGSMGGLNVVAFVVYTVKITTLTGSIITIMKRYSEFDKLRDNLLSTFPLSEHSIPHLPPKGVFDKFRPSFLEKRRRGLQYFLNCVLLNPEMCASPVVRGWLGMP